jgi:hypothetical protein
MAYTSSKIVEVVNNQLREFSDLTIPLSQTVGRAIYLVVTDGVTSHTLDVAAILLHEKNLSLTSPVSTIASLITDVFLETYSVDTIPTRDISGYYRNHLRVFSPVGTKTHTMRYTSMNTPDVVDSIEKMGFLDDLVITSTSSDMTNYMVCVNGVFHRTTLFQNKLYVHDGFRTVRLTGRCDPCVVDTTPIGGHQIIPITRAMCSLSKYGADATIDAGVSLAGKTILLVIAGYIYHMSSRAFYFANNSHIKVRTNRLQLVEQLRHSPLTMSVRDLIASDAEQASRKYNDPWDRIFLDTRVVPYDTFRTVEFQLARLSHYHSFIVVLNRADVFTTERELTRSPTPGIYLEESATPTSGIMSCGPGLCPSYLINEDPWGRKFVYGGPVHVDSELSHTQIDRREITALGEEYIDGQDATVRLVDYITV